MLNPILLTDGDCEVGVLPELGGCLSHFIQRNNNDVYHWLKPLELKNSDPKAEFSACFPLIPFSGRIKKGQFKHLQQTINLPCHTGEPNALHGDGWLFPWHVKKCDKNSLTMELKTPNNGWPWPYRASQNVHIKDNILSLMLTYKNISCSIVPVGLGFHPWFPAGATLQTELKELWQINADNLFKCIETIPEKWNFTQHRELANTDIQHGFTPWHTTAYLKWKERSSYLSITGSEELSHLIIYTRHPSGNFCLEPVSHSVDAFNLQNDGVPGNGTRYLNAGASLTVSMKIEIHNH